MNNKSLMELKNAIIKFLIILIVFELILDILKLIIPSQIQYLENSSIFTIVRAVFLILPLMEFYRHKVKFGFALLIVLVFPILIQIIQVGLGNIFIHFCPQQTNDIANQSLLGLLDKLQKNNCPYPTQFYFFTYIEQYIFYFKQIFSTNGFSYLWGLLISPTIVYFFLFYKLCLFKVFEENNRNPYLSLIPIVNTITILKMCKLPISWFFILLIPFMRLFWLFKINIRLCEIKNKKQSNAIWMTLIPPIFYGKLVFK